MKQFDFDNEVKKALNSESNRFGISETEFNDLKINIDRAIRNHEYKEKITMKKISIKNVIAVAAVAIMLTGTMCLAAGKATTTMTTSKATPDYTEFADLSKAEKDIEVPISGIEEFSNGYKFKNVSIEDSADFDDEMNQVRTYKTADIVYEKDGNKIYLDVIPHTSVSDYDRNKSEEITCPDGTLYYSKTTNKFVPVDYEMTEEDKKAEENGTLNIAYGSDEVEVKESQCVLWEKDGNMYMLFEMPASLDKDTLVEMAKEVVSK